MRIEKHVPPPHAVCRCDESAQRRYPGPGSELVCYGCCVEHENRDAKGIRVGVNSTSRMEEFTRLAADLVGQQELDTP